ncbi:hypothetical protein AVEN_217460-1 [Araneus ventricosus]|uniref:Uncharacterized protein n=1 Tax=Araneus ventricosus TaxID=182803 RepID=A0A4Y2JKV2_ARAVE|nr:hypothetical protein AVEN_217460-1 [Araneus ventricosus]
MKDAILEPLINKAKEIGPDGINVGRFFIPAVNFGDTGSKMSLTGKVVMSHRLQFSEIGSHELLKKIQDDVAMDGWNFTKFPSHNQAVDRIAKLFTEASKKTAGPQNSDRFMRATIESRKHMSKFKSKKDYKR